MQRLFVLGAAAAAVLAFVPVSAQAQAVQVVGRTLAGACFEAAEAGLPSRTSVESCTRALDEEPLSAVERAGTYVNRGVIRLHRGEIELALADFDAAQKAVPDFAQAYANRGVALMRQAKWADARANFDKAIEGDAAALYKTYFNRAAANEELGDLAAAYRDLKMAQELNPGDPDVALEISRFKVERNG